jgi:glycosyltransferase involved in cell wall biosynthesis
MTGPFPLDQKAKRRKVLVDLRGLDPSGINGGLQTYVIWLIKWVVKNHRDKFSFLAVGRVENVDLVSSLLGEEDALWIEGPLEATLSQGGEGTPVVVSGAWSVHTAVSKLDIQTVYAPLGALPCLSIPGVHSVGLVADMLHMEMPMCLDPTTVKTRVRNIETLVKHASSIQCISHSSETRLHHHVPAAIGKTFFSYLPVQDRFESDSRKEGLIPEIARPKSGRSYFFYPANFWPHKNHLALIIGYHQYVTKQGADAWDLVLTGADYGGGMGRAVETVKALRLEGRVQFLGYVSDQELGRIWRGAGGLVFPSLHEGFGIPLIEAMHHRVPILTSPNYSLLEIAGSAALYFNPQKPEQIGDRMMELASSPDLSAKLAERGADRLTQFSDSREASLVVDALLGQMPKRPPATLQSLCGCPL